MRAVDLDGLEEVLVRMVIEAARALKDVDADKLLQESKGGAE